MILITSSKDKGKGIMVEEPLKMKPKDLKNKSFASVQELFENAMKRENTFVDMDTELVEGSEIREEESSSKRESNKLEQKPTKSKSQLIKEFDREDLENLWKLVKAKHGNTRPEEGYERVLWVSVAGTKVTTVGVKVTTA
ncbi:hypothetical protein Tco_1237140 [Tanacetum coccineum]